MKINDSVKKTSDATVSTTQARGGKAAERVSTAKVGGSNVQQSSQLQALTAQVSSTSVFDTNKVEEIKSAIASGKFKVDPEKVANGLIDTVKDLIHTRKA